MAQAEIDLEIIERERRAQLENAVRMLIRHIGDDPDREGVRDTPRRVLDFYEEWRNAASADVRATTFAVDHQDLILVRDVPLFSLCEHHMLPFYGRMAIGYLSEGTVLGLSKIARLATREASRLTMQETLTSAIAECVSRAVETEHVGVVTYAVHTCMIMRGPRAYGSETVTSAMLGDFRRKTDLRGEFLRLIDSQHG